ncbi:hypothetical protein [Xenorhabdus hominickii]|nr:hypothetical protein [Xenorhabdus hominickii]
MVQAGTASFWARGMDTGSAAGHADGTDWTNVACRVHVWKVM